MGPHVRKLEAIWLNGAVPAGYWDHRENRRKYLRWSGQRLGYRKLDDFYRITTDDLKLNRGCGLLVIYWDSSVVFGVKDSFPEVDWKEWLFRSCPRTFWQDPRNHRRYMDWLGNELGFCRPKDWYQVTNKDFQRHKGGAFLLHYDSTVSAAVMAHFPDYDWKEWLFRKIPKGIWLQRKTRRRYLKWLGEQLGFRSMEEWYSVTRDDFEQNHGNNLLKMYSGSPYLLLKDTFPQYAWKEWKFARVPLGFWNEPENRQRYMQWLGRELRCRRPEDWRQVRRRDFLEHCGAGFLTTVHSYVDVLQEHVPSLDWSGTRSEEN